MSGMNGEDSPALLPLQERVRLAEEVATVIAQATLRFHHQLGPSVPRVDRRKLACEFVAALTVAYCAPYRVDIEDVARIARERARERYRGGDGLNSASYR